MVAEERSVWWLTEAELDKWREAMADIAAAENATLYDATDRQLVRSLYFHQWELLAEVYDTPRSNAPLGLDKTRELDINPATGCITYVPMYDVELTE